MDAATTTLIKRLEEVTKRLESVEKQLASGVSSGAPAASSGSSDGESPMVAEYTALINTHIKPFVAVTATIGNDELKAQVALVEKAINAQNTFLQVVASCKKPTDQAVLMKHIEGTSKLMQEVSGLRDKQRANKLFNHLSTLSEGISCLGWVMVEPTPVPFINESRGSSEFYSNKLLVEHKKSGEQAQLDWVSHWNTFMKELAVFVKKYHNTGLVWNPRGGDAASFSGASATPAASGAAPPPPAGKPPVVAAAKGPAPDSNALFAALNKGGDITSGLKKITKDMTNKNKVISGAIPADAAPSKKAAAPKTAVVAKKGTPKFELQGNKWVVEFQEDATLDINDPEVRHTVYMYKCERTVVKINGKVNSIVLDSCKKSGVVFGNAVASCEVVNCISVDVQCTGKVPNIAIDKCSGVQVYLGKDSLDTEIITSKSDAMNVLIPDPAGGIDLVETPIPEQYKTLIINGKLSTNIVEHAG